MTSHARPHDPRCLFCKIIRGEIPSATVLETDARRRLPRHPSGHLGHVLLVPKAHHADLTELPEALAAPPRRSCPGSAADPAATGADGFNVIVNNGRAAGQTIDHGHWHIIPRFHDDPVDWPWPHSEYVGDELGQMRFRIERELNPRTDD